MKARMFALAFALLLTPAQAAPAESAIADLGSWSQRLDKGLTTRQVQHLSIQGRSGAADLGRVETRPVNVGKREVSAGVFLSGNAHAIPLPRAYLSSFEANALAIRVRVL